MILFMLADPRWPRKITFFFVCIFPVADLLQPIYSMMFNTVLFPKLPHFMNKKQSVLAGVSPLGIKVVIGSEEKQQC